MEIQELANEYATIVDSYVFPKTYFKKRKYKPYFEQFVEKHKMIFEYVNGSFQEFSEEEKEEAAKAIAKAYVERSKKKLEGLKGFKKRTMEEDITVFLVTSVFPCTLELSEQYGETICQAIVNQWKKDFHRELGYGTFDVLYSGFRGFFGALVGKI